MYTFYGKITWVYIKNVCNSIEKILPCNDYDDEDSADSSKNLYAPHRALISVTWFNLVNSNFSKLTHSTIVSQKKHIEIECNLKG